MRAVPHRSAVAIILAFSLVACGGSDAGKQTDRGRTSAETGRQTSAGTSGEQASQALTMPDWMEIDRSAGTATLEVVAGKSDANNSWNFNGYANGEVEVVVPVDFEVTIDFRNADQVTAHSLGIDEKRQSWPATFQNPQPVFEGAITSGPASMEGATQPGEMETIVFTTEEAGEYTMVCYIPGHANQGMWIYFTVSADGKAGLRKLPG